MRTVLGRISQVFSGLRFRLLVLVVVVCAPLVAVMLHTSWEDRRRALTGWRQRARNLTQVNRREEQALVAGTRQLLLAMAESSSVRSLNPSRSQKWLEEMWAAYPRYSNLGVIATNGNVVATAASVADHKDDTLGELVRRALQTRTYAVGSFPTNTLKHPILSFAYPVLDHEGDPLAVVFAELDLQWYYRFGSELPAQLPRPQAFWTEIDRHGRILARYPKPQEWIGRTFIDPEQVETFFTQSNGVIQVDSKTGFPMVYAFQTRPSQLAGLEVATILATPEHVLFADADGALRRNLTWLGIAASLALALGWMGGRLLILAPVRALVKSSLHLATGDSSSHSPGLRRDELGQLASAFNRMAKVIEERERERKKASQKLQVMSQRLVEVQENERRHIARELHDEIGQSLTAAEMNLQAALQEPSSASVERRLEESIRAVERVLEQVHDLSLNLRPSMLDDLGLEPALRWYTHRQASLMGLRAEFHADRLDGRLDSRIETECFRVAQEALTNVVRHSQASSVKLKLSHRNGHLHLSVRDDGIGFDVAALREQAVLGASLGLLSMEERTALAGGGLEFKSSPGKGTEVHDWFPLRWRESVTQSVHE